MPESWGKNPNNEPVTLFKSLFDVLGCEGHVLNQNQFFCRCIRLRREELAGERPHFIEAGMRRERQVSGGHCGTACPVGLKQSHAKFWLRLSVCAGLSVVMARWFQCTSGLDGLAANCRSISIV